MQVEMQRLLPDRHDPTRAAALRQGRELVVSAALAAATTAIVVAAVPRGGDAAAHLYRTILVRGGSFLWDNLWFGGQYPLTSYSVAYYLLAGWIGNIPLCVAAVVLSAVLFSILVRREWGAAGRWPARVFALVAAGQLFTGAYDYVAGSAALLGSLVCLQRGRTVCGVLLAGLTLALSPLAFVFLAIVLVAVWLPTRRLGRTQLLVAGGLAAFAAAELLLLSGFPVHGLYYPYDLWRLLAGIGVAGLGIALGLRARARGGTTIASLFCVWLAASVVAYLVPSPVGHNVTRLAGVVLPVMLLAARLARFRPRWLVALALAAAAAASVGPYLALIPQRTTDPGARAAFWRPLLGFLDAHRSAQFRVEAVPTANHWETYYLPENGLQLARGWYRQLDIADNPVLYRRRLTAAEYRAWLRSVGVRYVVVADLEPGAMGAAREARLVRTPGDGFREVFRSRSGSIYELRHPAPILTGRRPARLTAVGHTRITGWVAGPGPYLLRVHFTPYWHLSGAPACVATGRDGMTSIRFQRGGRFTLTTRPSFAAVGARAVDGAVGAQLLPDASAGRC